MMWYGVHPNLACLPFNTKQPISLLRDGFCELCETTHLVLVLPTVAIVHRLPSQTNGRKCKSYLKEIIKY